MNRLEESIKINKIENEDNNISNIIKNFEKGIKINLYDNLNIFFYKEIKYISITPILEISQLDNFILLYNLNISKAEILQKIKNFWIKI